MFPYVSTGQDIFGLLAWIVAYLFLITIIILAIHFIIAVLVYRDAREHGMSAYLWAIAILILPLLFFFLGLFVYLVAVFVIAIAYLLARDRTHGFTHGKSRRSGWRRD